MAYDYTIQDVYKIFEQSEDKVAQLREFAAMNLPFDINWDRLIEQWGGVSAPVEVSD